MSDDPVETPSGLRLHPRASGPSRRLPRRPRVAARGSLPPRERQLASSDHPWDRSSGDDADESAQAIALQPGVCIDGLTFSDDDGTFSFGSLEETSCGRPHDAEVYYVFTNAQARRRANAYRGHVQRRRNGGLCPRVHAYAGTSLARSGFATTTMGQACWARLMPTRTSPVSPPTRTDPEQAPPGDRKSQAKLPRGEAPGQPRGRRLHRWPVIAVVDRVLIRGPGLR